MTAARDAAVAVIGLGGVGDAFFCAVTVEEPDTGTDLTEVAAALLAAAEARFGPVASLEARRRGGRLLVQAAHAGGAVVAQLMVRVGAGPAATVELDGDRGSLRLDRGGRLLRHEPGAALEVPVPTAAPATTPDHVRAALRRALAEAAPAIA